MQGISYELSSLTCGYPDASILADISDSHERCFQSGLKPSDRPKVGVPASVYPQRRHLEKVAIDYLVKDLHEFVSSLGGIVLHAYGDNVVVDYRSDFDQTWFRQHGLMGGLDLSETSLGTTAFCLLGADRDEAWVHGKDHYLDLLRPFASYCTRTADEDGVLFTFILLPEERFDDSALRYFRLYEKAKREAIRRYYSQLKAQTYQMIDQEEAIADDSSGSLFVDTFGRILWSDRGFQRMFNLEDKSESSIDVFEIIPKLGAVLAAISTDYPLVSSTLDVTSSMTLNGKFIVCQSCEPVFYRGNVSALAFSFKASRLNPFNGHSGSNRAVYTFADIVGESASLRAVIREAEAAALHSSAVLLLGESGTGKELVAQSIHNAGMRRKMPFVALNCSNMRSDLAESELFGYVPGAFTGASSKGAAGKIEYADGGTLFLDEVGELPYEAQSMLLRVLEDHEVCRIGSNVPKRVDFRLICATNRNLWDMVQDGRFRLDLYYRLNVMCISLPSLKDRPGDVELLLNYFLAKFANTTNGKLSRIRQEALDVLLAYSWPGNIRELRNAIESACIAAGKQEISIEHLPAKLLDAVLSSDDVDSTDVESIDVESSSSGISEDSISAKNNTNEDLSELSVLENEERKRLIDLYLKTNGNKSKMAKELGISRTTLYRKLERYGL